jgi:hypothetical protein
MISISSLFSGILIFNYLFTPLLQDFLFLQDFLPFLTSKSNLFTKMDEEIKIKFENRINYLKGIILNINKELNEGKISSKNDEMLGGVK